MYLPHVCVWLYLLWGMYRLDRMRYMRCLVGVFSCDHGILSSPSKAWVLCRQTALHAPRPPFQPSIASSVDELLFRPSTVPYLHICEGHILLLGGSRPLLVPLRWALPVPLTCRLCISSAFDFPSHAHVSDSGLLFFPSPHLRGSPFYLEIRHPRRPAHARPGGGGLPDCVGLASEGCR